MSLPTGTELVVVRLLIVDATNHHELLAQFQKLGILLIALANLLAGRAPSLLDENNAGFVIIHNLLDTLLETSPLNRRSKMTFVAHVKFYGAQRSPNFCE